MAEAGEDGARDGADGEGKPAARPAVALPEIPPDVRGGLGHLKTALDLEGAGARNGAAGEPRGDAIGPFDQPQFAVAQEASAQIAALTSHLQETLEIAHQALAKASSEAVIDAERITVYAEAEKRKLLQSNAAIDDVSTRMVSAERDYRAFRNKNRITREARYRESPYLFFAVLFGLLVVEAFANAILLRHVSSQGWVGGVFIASFISLVNVMLGVLGGAVGWRLAGHAALPLRIVGIVTTVATLALAFLWNIYVAHFREAAEAAVAAGEVGGSVLEGALGVGAHIQRNGLFGLSSVLSWLLFAVGLFVFLLVCRESWEDMADRYWDYKRVDMAFRDVEGEYAGAFDGFKAGADGRFAQIVQEVQGQAQSALKRFDEAEALAKLAEQRFGEVQDRQAQIAQEAAALLRAYRDANIRARPRGASPPPGWDAYPTLSDYREGRVGAIDDEARTQRQSRWRAAERRLDDVRLRLADLRDQSRDNKRAVREIESRLSRMQQDLPQDIEDFRRSLEDQGRRRIRARGGAEHGGGGDDGAA